MVKFLRHLKSQVRGASSKEMAESRESSDSRVLSSEVAKVDSTVYSSTFSLLQSEKASPSSPSSPSLPSSSGREGQTPQTGEAGEAGNGAVPRSEEMKGDRSRGQGGGKSPSADHGVQQISFVQQQDALYFLTVMRLAVATTMACHDEGARSMCLAGNGRLGGWLSFCVDIDHLILSFCTEPCQNYLSRHLTKGRCQTLTVTGLKCSL